MAHGPRPNRGSAGEATTATHAAHLRALNADRVLRIAIDTAGTFTRAELIEASGLSAPTVGSVTADLISKGMLKDLGTAPSRGGRRPVLMEFNARHGFVAGIDLGPTRTRLAVGDLRGQALGERIVVTPTDVPPPVLVAQMASALKGLMGEVNVPEKRLLVVVAGAPGPVDLSSGTVLYAPNLHGWNNVPLQALLREHINTAAVIENDVNLALLGEHSMGAARGHRTCVFFFVGTGIGSAILIDGVLHHGHHYMAGEVGAMVMAPEHVGRDFGTRGCLETLAGMKGLRERWDPAGTEAPERWFASLMEAYARGDSRAREAVDESATLIAMAAAQIGAAIDPSVLVLGGSMFAEPGPIVSAVRRVIRQIARTPFEVVLSALGKEAPLAGCLLVGAHEAQRALRQQLRGAQRRRMLQ
jgi:glucokinase